MSSGKGVGYRFCGGALLFTVLTLLLSWPALADVIYDSHGFDSFNMDVLNGQDGWVGTGVPSILQPTMLGDATHRFVGLGAGGTSDSASIMAIGFAQNLATHYNIVDVKFDVARLTQLEVPAQLMIWLWTDGGDPVLGGQVDLGAGNFTYPLLDPGYTLFAPTVFDRFATVEMKWDFDSGLATGWYDGNLLGTQPIGSISSFTVFAIGLMNSGQTFEGIDVALVDNFSITGEVTRVVPEPMSLVLLAFGAGAVLVRQHVKRQA